MSSKVRSIIVNPPSEENLDEFSNRAHKAFMELLKMKFPPEVILAGIEKIEKEGLLDK